MNNKALHRSQTPSILIKQAGPFAQIQDSGRRGQLAQGLSKSGALDEIAYRYNNALLNNEDNAAQIEVGLGGFCAEAKTACTIAITGADLNAHINTQRVLNWASYALNPGDILRLPNARNGCFAYLGIHGGFDTPISSGSRSTTERLGLGGIGGALLADITVLKALPSLTRIQAHYCLPPPETPDYQNPVIDIVDGYQSNQFTTEQIKQFYNQRYALKRSNRMGYFVESAQALKMGTISAITSEGLLPGAIQVPPNGYPIILHRDAQSIGGYPKIGSVTRLGLALLAQKKVGDSVYFKNVAANSARAEYTSFLESVNVFKQEIKRNNLF